MKTTSNIRIHTHAGNVALSFEGLGQTVYLSPTHASWLARKLAEAVSSGDAFETSEWPRCNAPLEALKRACSKGDPIVEIPAPHLKTFTVITVSANTNAFGYRSVLCLAEDGEGLELLVQAYGTDKVPVRGDHVREDEPRFFGAPRPLPRATPAQARKILKEVKP